MGGRLARANAAIGIAGYVGTIAIVIAIIVALTLFCTTGSGSSWALCALVLLALIPASDAALALVNRGAMDLIGATVLPGLELRGGIPRQLRTMVVIPTLLTTRAALEEQIERLEVHHLASPDGDIRFALLSDWTDSAAEHAPGDDELFDAAVDGIAQLNRRHEPAPDGDRFLLLHRRRVWNEGQRKWIGWERKRGKLHELNRLLRGASDTTFLAAGGGTPVVPDGVRYVITLDGDTRLPRSAAKRLVGKMAHPLNRPLFDAATSRVVDGHAVLQPRVTPSLPVAREGSFFQRVYSSSGGLDPYAFAVSDVYQDLFGEGSYSGKGIYDVDAFEAALEGRVPDSTLLSHDLFEGTFARAGLCSDIEVVEEFPSRYNVAAARQHRWARGDWQLFAWIFGRGPDSNSAPGRSAMPLIGRWKMLDNLRRTLSAPAAFVALLGGWILPFASAAAWSGFVLATIATPALLPVLAGIAPRRRGISVRSHVFAVGSDLKLALSQVILQAILLAHQAWLMADAIGRTLFRRFVSHRNLLEWIAAAQARISPRLDLGGFYRQMAGGVALAAAAGALVAWARPGSWPIAAPFVALWLVSPAVARWASLPPGTGVRKPISAADARSLRLIARRTWRFFETFVTAEDHMLPPDNFQEVPKPVLAHRTSPTNLGLYLLSVVAAREFGWLATLDAVDRLEATLGTMDGLERFRGHFYNWYETRELRPLDPKYISSVDSGNLAGHLIALLNYCRGRIDRPVAGPEWVAGIEDALALARESLCALPDRGQRQSEAEGRLDAALDALTALLKGAPATATGVVLQLAELAHCADGVAALARTLAEERGGDGSADVLIWAEAMRASIRSHLRDIELLLPWASLLAGDDGFVAAIMDRNAAPEDALGPFLATIPTLADLPDHCEAAIRTLAHRRAQLAAETAAGDGARAKLDALVEALEGSARAARALEGRLAALATLAGKMFWAMEFDFLLDPARLLLSIGYRVADGSLDPGCYDLLASEARLASFVAIAKGDAPARHWFRLGRAVTPVDYGSALISWSGSMFEYLMPSLVMRAPAGSLLDQTARLVVRRQMKHGAALGLPWGVSESAYNARDLELTYQYLSFGIPGLGLKRGLSENAVIAPYATALAAMVDPAAAVKNFSALTAAGGRGGYGWYDALDYTPTRLPEGEEVAIVFAYMAHHQGMTVVAIANALRDGAMRACFHAEPIVEATELLLQERPPRERRGRSAVGRRGALCGACPGARSTNAAPVSIAA